MWKPFDPDVFTQLGSPSSASRSRSAERRGAQHLRIVLRRIEIEDADVRVVQIRRARRPHVRRDGVLVRDPEQRPRVGDDRVMHRAVLLRHLDALEPVRKALRDILLDEPLLPIPAGYRSIVTGRSRMCGSMSGAIAS